MRLAKCIFVLLVVLVVGCATLQAQTSTSATVLGTVRDASNAVVTGAQVTLRNVATNSTRADKTNAEGYYTFSRVDPGAYTLTVEMTGFQKAALSGLNFDVTKSYTVDVSLKVGTADQTITVSTEAAIELQTTDATIGNLIGSGDLLTLPTISRNALELLTLQPGAMPLSAQGDTSGLSGGGVSGARSDQNAIALDGVDITNIFSPSDSTGSTVVPMNVEALAEFRVGVSNPNASVASASGGQVSVATKGGSNNFHGSVYYYIQNTALNANSWENGHTPVTDPITGNQITSFTPRPPIHDNRGGFTFGGPIRKDKTFFFVNYEPRRFITSYGGSGNTSLNVPSLDFRNGIINFTDPVTLLPAVACLQNSAQATANVTSPGSAFCNTVPVNSNGARISSNCGPTADQPCDPRGLGMSPAVAKLLSFINPSTIGNNPSGNDGIGCSTSPSCQNLTQYLFNTGDPVRDDAFSVRLDHNFSQNLHFVGRYEWIRDTSPAPPGATGQIDLTGASPKLIGAVGNRGDALVAGLDWSIRANLINSLHFGWVRQRQDFATFNQAAIGNKFKVAGTQDASGNYVGFFDGYAGGASAANLFAQPISAPTTNGFNRGKNIQFSDDLNWIKGTHTMVFGADVRWQPTYVTADVAAGQGDFSSVQAISDSVASGTNDIPSGASAADHLYSSMLGLVNHVGYIQTLDSSFQPIPGHPIADLETHTHALYFYFQDSWRMKPSLTLTYGLAWGVQAPFSENKGRLEVLVDASTNKPVDAPTVLATTKADALKGINNNPTYGFVPYGKLGMSGMWNTDWSDIAPRASIAWSPSADSGLMGKLFGNKKTVIRTGYAMVYDRLSGGTIAKLFGQPGFAQDPMVNFPACDASGSGGTLCTPASGDPAMSGFRVGFDGPIPVPGVQATSAPSATNPFVPDVGAGGFLVTTLNPNFKMGRNHMIDFSIQRELPGNMIMEVGYIGRLGRRLPGLYPLNSDPYMFTDVTKLDGTPGSGQSFAQANDCVAQLLRGLPTSAANLGSFGCSSSGVDSLGNLQVASQPWFENQLPAGFGNGCGPGGANVSNTQCMVNGKGDKFVEGNIGGIFGVFARINDARCGPLGTNASTLAQFQSCALSNQQVTDLQQRTSNDFSNYHALTFTLRNRGWHGLTYDMNYTWSKSLDQGGRTQSFINGFDDPWNPSAMYGPAYFDRKHVFNTIFNYNLPFGQGHKLSSGIGAVNRFIGGWSFSGVFRANSGLPLVVAQSGFTYGGGLVTTNNVDMIPTGHNFSTGLNHYDPNTAKTPTGACATFAAALGSTQIGSNSASTGLNYFSDPAAAFCSFRPVLLTTDTRDGRGNPLRGFGMWNLDASIGKETAITERVKVRFSADFFNFFNHLAFTDPLQPPLSPTDFIDVTRPNQFGAISNSFTPAQRPTGSRWIQLGMRVDF
jgi:hypothetical protein